MYLATWLGAAPGTSAHDRAEDAAAVVARKRLTGVGYAEWFYSAGLARMAEASPDAQKRPSRGRRGRIGTRMPSDVIQDLRSEIRHG